MKKEVKKILILLTVIVVLLTIIAIDLFWVREKPNPNVEYVDERLVDAYSLQDLGDEVVFTTYSEGPAIRVVKTYDFSDGKLESCNSEHYYPTKLHALFSLEDIKGSNTKVELKGNVIYCKPVQVDLGKNKDKFIKDMEETYNKVSVKIEK